MFDISTLDEARELLATENFSTGDAQKVLLYLVERDAEYRKGFEKLQAILIGVLETSGAILTGFTKVAIPDLEVRRQLNEAGESLDAALQLTRADALVH